LVIRFYFHIKLGKQLSLKNSQKVFSPANAEELRDIVIMARKSNIKISVAGQGYSMGGQTYFDDGYQISTNKLTKIIDFQRFNQNINLIDISSESRSLKTSEENSLINYGTITVESGCKWYNIIDYISRYGYSIECMQSFCDFSVGGSISVNCHGQDIMNNPMISSILSIQLCDSNGRIITITPLDNLFYYVVGGYGLFGVIISVKLRLTLNRKIKSEAFMIDINDYENTLINSINNGNIMFHSGRVDITDFSKCVIINYSILPNEITYNDSIDIKSKSNDLILYPERIKLKKSFMEGISIAVISNIQSLKKYKRLGEEKHVENTTRNMFMISTVNSLQTPFYITGNFILQEYFIPLNRNKGNNLSKFDYFMIGLNQIIQTYKINLINISLRYVKPNNSILSYSPEESIAIVLYIDLDKYKSIDNVIEWTREIITLALNNDGHYYLPYHLFATKEQFIRSYPLYQTFITEKYRYDPTDMFQSHLWKFIKS
jgi:FAD/FMN-containing dehydrogenase